MTTEKAMANLYRSVAVILLSALIYFVKQDLNTAHENSVKLNEIQIQTARTDERTRQMKEDIDQVELNVSENQNDINRIFRKLGVYNPRTESVSPQN